MSQRRIKKSFHPKLDMYDVVSLSIKLILEIKTARVTNFFNLRYDLHFQKYATYK